MANHCYLTSKFLPHDLEVIAGDVEECTARLSKRLTIQRDGNCFQIFHNPLGHDRILMWVERNGSKCVVRGDRIVYTDGSDLHSSRGERGWSVLEFRHGHSNPMYWWFESVFRSFFVEKYQCLVTDDGIGDYDEQPASETFVGYMQKFTEFNRLHDLDLLRLCLRQDECRDVIIPLIGMNSLPKVSVDGFEMHVEWESI